MLELVVKSFCERGVDLTPREDVRSVYGSQTGIAQIKKKGRSLFKFEILEHPEFYDTLCYGQKDDDRDLIFSE